MSPNPWAQLIADYRWPNSATALTGAILERHSATTALLDLILGRLSEMLDLLTGLAAQRAKNTASATTHGREHTSHVAAKQGALHVSTPAHGLEQLNYTTSIHASCTVLLRDRSNSNLQHRKATLFLVKPDCRSASCYAAHCPICPPVSSP